VSCVVFWLLILIGHTVRGGDDNCRDWSVPCCTSAMSSSYPLTLLDTLLWMVLWYDGWNIKLPGSLTLTPISSPQCDTTEFRVLSTAGVKGNCRFRDICVVRSWNVACCSLLPHGFIFASAEDMGTVWSCSAVTFVATYFFPAPWMRYRNEVGKNPPKNIINKN
jgi:hypothetical protein